MIDVPFYPQANDYACGPASLQMVLGFFGVHLSQAKLADSLKTSPDTGTRRQAMIDLVTGQGFYCYVNEGSNIDEVRYYLSRGYPVVVNYVEPQDDEGHYAVVVKLTDATIYMNDPWNGEGIEIAAGDFEARWHNQAGDVERWMMVVSDEDLQLGRQYHPKA